MIDLSDIQGIVTREYGRLRFPYARHLFFRFNESETGRAFVDALSRHVTTSIPWGEGADQVKTPRVTTNIAFTASGLAALHLPHESLASFPEEFLMGMKKRKAVLGDTGPSDPQFWDPVWQQTVHAWLSINAQQQAEIEARFAWIEALLADTRGGVVLLTGHRAGDRADVRYQDAQMLFEHNKPVSKEHFGYVSGISNPVFEGLPGADEHVVGRGKLDRAGQWLPLATGELLLGHLDEAKEYPKAPTPDLLAHNGTFMVYRKLHQNVGSFAALIEQQGQEFPGGKDLLAAKLMGRWADNGAPLTSAGCQEQTGLGCTLCYGGQSGTQQNAQ